MINLGKLKKIKSNFPVLVAEKAIPKNICKNLTSEISASRAFDDMIMGGRSRINKGNPRSFNQKKFTLKRKVNSKELIKLLGDDYRNPILNLDIDFSVSKGGYRLRPHRDDVTRLYNFLIYLTDIPKKNGGSLILYKKKSKKNIRKSFRRFPKISELKIVKEFTPKQGTVIFFKSTPNSYHGVKRFKEFNCPKRFFIYGSYALNKPVIWSFKNNNYFPTIVPNNKRMLTSFHDSNYLLKKIS